MGWVDEMLKRSREVKPLPCTICGKPTLESFYGWACCDPYDEKGRRVSNCKYQLRDEASPYRNHQR